MPIWEIEGTGFFHYSDSDMAADRIPDINGASIVLGGNFNPSIFQPEWFGRQNLLPIGEVEAAKVQAIVREVCQFETERFIVQVTEERFYVGTKPNTDTAPLLDLVVGTFYVLEHTRVNALGLNTHQHFALESEEAWHRFGDKLAPKDGWNDILEGRPGMLALAIQSQVPNGPTLTIRVEPSKLVKFGVYFDTNAHYQKTTLEAPKALLEIATMEWQKSLAYAAKIAKHIINWTAE